MRSVLAICFLIALCASVDAAARGHNPKARPVIVRPPQTPTTSFVTPSVSGSIAIPPFRVDFGPFTTTLLPSMIHPSLAAPDLQ